MLDLVSPLLQWLNTHPEFAGLVTFIISASESVAIIGTIIPGSITMTALGALAGAGVISLWSTLLWATIGAIVGDGISYWIGHAFKDRIKRLWFFRNHPSLLDSGEKFVLKYGVMSVFIGRFVGPVRALVPLVAGMLGMKPFQFAFANIISAIGWAPAYMLPGILLGAASLELPPDIAVHVMLVLVLVTLFTLLCLWTLYRLLKLFHEQTDQMQNWIWQRLKKSRALSPLTVLLKHHDASKTHGQLNLAFYFLFTAFLFVCLAACVKYYGAANLMVNDTMYHLFRGMHTKRVDTIMLNITLLGQKEIVLPVVIVIFAWLMFWKRWRAAFHALALGILVSGSVFVLKHLLKSARPWGILANPETYSMPSGHTAIATTVFMGLAFLIASAIRPKLRWPVYTCGMLIALSVGISRMYLGAHWFTDVVSSWLLGASILMAVIISYERRLETRINPLGILLVTLISMSCTYGYYHYKNFKQLQIDYTQINYPVETVTMQTWWDKNTVLPAYYVSLFGFPSQAINVVWAGELDKIEATLRQDGWATPPARDWISTLHRVADIQSSQYLSMISPQYLDRKPELILARSAEGMKGLMVLRLWRSNRMVGETQAPLWVGIIGEIPRSYSWLFRTHPGELDIDPSYIFPNKNKVAEWQWKLIEMNHSTRTQRMADQTIMFIRKN